jgi:hypothetical protein
VNIYTLWASMKGEDVSPWMLAAEDEFSWEANPGRCERAFSEARALAERNGWEVREITLTANLDAVCAAFEPAEIAADVTVQRTEDER